MVLAEAATSGAEPRPASLEKIPRAIPFCRAMSTVAPAKPPTADVAVNAELKIKDTASGILSILMHKTVKAAAT